MFGRKRLELLKIEKRLKRKRRIRSKVFGLSERPRLNVFRSNDRFPEACTFNDRQRNLILKGINDETVTTQGSGHANGYLPFVISSTISMNLFNPILLALSHIRTDFKSSSLTYNIYDPFSRTHHILQMGYHRQFYIPKALSLFFI